MPRIRTLKPEFFRSPSTAKVDPLVRIFYQALWCWADDFGIGETNIYGWLGFAFPDGQQIYDEQLRTFRALSAPDLRRFCADCAQHYEVAFYIVRGRHYYAVKNWDQHQKTERRTERRRNPTPEDPDAVPDLRFQHRALSAPELRRENGADSRENVAGTGEQGNRGTGEDDYPREPPDDDPPDEPRRRDVVVVEPRYIETPTKRPRPQPSSAALTVVRQTLGPVGQPYPRETHNRLAVQVDKLERDHPDTVVRQALTEWDRRPDCAKPEFLATVLSDVVKASRASPVTSAHDRKVNNYLNADIQLPQPRKELAP